MRVLHFSTSDVVGGAARAAHRLHAALRASGCTSRMMVRRKRSDDPDVDVVPTSWPRFVAQQLRQRALPLAKPAFRYYTFNRDYSPPVDASRFVAIPPAAVDVVCLHWVSGFLSTHAIRRIAEHFRRPLVWVLMDQEPITGGCHYSHGCGGFTASCGRCPQLASRREVDRSRVVWERKRRLLGDLPITFVAPTGWLRERVAESSLFGRFPVAEIPLAIDSEVYAPGAPAARAEARARLGLPGDRHVLFVGAQSLEDPRKGMRYLVDALLVLAERLRMPDAPFRAEDVHVLVAGRRAEGFLRALPFAATELGYAAGDVALAEAFRAADAFVCPSVEDAGPMMIPEALLCGTPVVAFDTGGAPDVVFTGETGYLARLRDAEDLAAGIVAVLADRDPADMRRRAREVAVARHAAPVVAAAHVALYQAITSERAVAGVR